MKKHIFGMIITIALAAFVLAFGARSSKAESALKVSDVNYSGGWGATLVNFTNNSGETNWGTIDNTKIQMYNSKGEAVTTRNNSHESYVFMFDYTAQVGDYVVISKGFDFYGYVAQNEIVCTYTTADTPWTVEEKVELPELKINDINWSGDWKAVLVSTNTDCGVASPWGPAPSQGIVYQDKDGKTIEINWASMNNYLFGFNRTPELGDTITFTTSTQFSGAEIKSEVKYEYSTENQPWTVYVEKVELPALEVADINYSGGWGATLVNFKNNSGEAGWGTIDTTKITIYNAKGEAVTTRNNSHESYVFMFDYTAQVGDVLVIEKGFQFYGYEAKEEIKYEYTTADQPWTVYVEKVELPELKINDINWSGDWNAVLVSTNTDCGVASPWGPAPSQGIVYQDKDGKTIEINWASMNNYLYGFNRTPELGDTITFTTSTQFSGAEIKSEVKYEYSTENQPWTVYVEKVELPELVIKDINFDSEGWKAVLIGTNTDCGVANPWGPAPTGEIIYQDASGTTYTLNIVGLNNYMFCFNRASEKGDIITLKAGLTFAGAELKQDVSYIYATEGQPWVVYDPTTALPELSINDINFSADWKAVLVNTNTDCGVATPWGPAPTGDIVYQDKNGNVIEINWASMGNYLYGFNRTPELGDTITFTTSVQFSGAEIKKEVKYVYSTENAPWTIYVPETPALSISDINWSAAWNATLIRFGNDSGVAGFDEFDATLVEYKNSQGKALTGRVSVHEYYIFIFDHAAQIGDTITFRAGLEFYGRTLKEDVTYIYAEADHPWVIDDGSYVVEGVAFDKESAIVRIDATQQLVWTVKGSTICTPDFSSSNEEVATVDANGIVTGIKEGKATITIAAGTKTATIEIEVKPALATTGIVADQFYTVYVIKGEAFAIPSDFTAKGVMSDGNETLYSPAFELNAENTRFEAVDTATAGSQTITLYVTYGEKDYQLSLDVIVYEKVAMEIKEVAIVEWFAFNIFVQYPNSTTNVANLTNGADYPKAMNYVYTRADGTEIACGTYNLGGGNIVILPGFNDGKLTLETFCSEGYYQVGDMITLKKGLVGYTWTGELAPTATDNGAIAAHTGMVIEECELQEDVTFKFDGSIWALYIQYNDIEVANEAIEVGIGKTKSVGASRVPASATEGEFTYVSSDESIVKVSSKGVVTGVAQGTATITITLNGGAAGEKVATVAVTVVDSIQSLKITTDKVNVEYGADLDVSAIKAYLVYASGNEVEVDLKDAKIVGLDTEEEGEQTVSIKVTVDGKSYTANITVNVTKKTEENPNTTTAVVVPTTAQKENEGGNDPINAAKGLFGCESSIGMIAISIPMIALCGVVIAKKRKENE